MSVRIPLTEFISGELNLEIDAEICGNQDIQGFWYPELDDAVLIVGKEKIPIMNLLSPDAKRELLDEAIKKEEALRGD